jgi:hypothetical protein
MRFALHPEAVSWHLVQRRDTLVAEMYAGNTTSSHVRRGPGSVPAHLNVGSRPVVRLRVVVLALASRADDLPDALTRARGSAIVP